MKRFALLVVIFSALGSAIYMLPARLIISEGHYLTPQRFMTIEQVRGTFWSGQMVLKSRQNALSVRLDWSTSALCLLGLRVCASLTMETLGNAAKRSALAAGVSVPLPLFNSGCSPIGKIKVTEVNGAITDSLLKVFIPELLSAEQRITLEDLSLGVNFTEGLVTRASGGVSIDSGLVKYQVRSQARGYELAALKGIVSEDDGFKLSLANDVGTEYLTVATSPERDQLSLVVYDAFAQSFGAPSSRTGENIARFEMSQNIGDMLCSPEKQ